VSICFISKNLKLPSEKQKQTRDSAFDVLSEIVRRYSNVSVKNLSAKVQTSQDFNLLIQKHILDILSLLDPEDSLYFHTFEGTVHLQSSHEILIP